MENQMENQIENQIVLPEWQTLTEYLINEPVGKVFDHDELARKMLVKEGSQKYYNLMQKTISHLTTVGIRLSNVKGVGYKILAPDEWVVEIKSKMKKGGKALAEAHLIINHAPYLKMSEEVRLECIKIHDVIMKQKFLLSGGLVEVLDSSEKKTIQIREGNKL